jgi:hypothetical protein
MLRLRPSQAGRDRRRNHQGFAEQMEQIARTSGRTYVLDAKTYRNSPQEMRTGIATVPQDPEA